MGKPLSFYELLFYVVAFISSLVLLSFLNAFVRGRRRLAWVGVRIYLVVVGIYATVLLATTLAMPIRSLPMGETQYSGDWSIAPITLRRIPIDLDEDYQVDFRLSNRSRASLRGPKGLVVYLLSENGTRYNADATPSDPPFDVLIQPGKSVTTTRKFVLPTNLNRVELVIAQHGLRWRWFVIGRSAFDGRTVILLQ